MTNDNRVLIVDDEVDFAEAMAEALTDHGYIVETADSISAAEAIIKDFDAQVALLDIRLGQSSGVELLARLKRSDPKPLCVMMTAYASAESAIDALHEGAVDYLHKPVQPEKVFATLRGLFERLRLAEEKRTAEEALKKAYAELENKVAERTQELATANLRLRELDQLKSMFVASVSHELRTPLNSIIGFSGILLEGMTGPISEQQKDQLQRINRAGNHLLHLIADVIDVSKIEAGKIDAHPESFLLSALLEEAISTVQTQADEKQLTIELAAFEDISITSDRKRLLQCLLNYLSNAVKFSESGTVTVTVSSTKTDVEIGVTDTGPGMSEQELENLFRPFVRLGAQRSHTIPGTGLGLYLTKKLSREVLRGSVRAESEPGKGSTFTVILPKVWPELNHHAAQPD